MLHANLVTHSVQGTERHSVDLFEGAFASLADKCIVKNAELSITSAEVSFEFRNKKPLDT